MTGHTEIQEWRDIPHKDQNEEIVIRFRIFYEDAGRQSVLNVAAEIFRAVLPLEIHVVESLRFDHETPFRVAFTGGRRVHGWLRWRTGLDVQYSQQIMGRVEIEETDDIYYWNYIGFMICFGNTRPVPPTPPVPPPDNDPPEPGPLPIPNTADGMAIADAHLEAGELFPFVYIKPWPKLAASLVEQRFMTVSASAAASTFYTKLKAADPATKRETAVTFIDDTISPEAGGGPSEPFVTPTQPLAPPYQSFRHFPHHLRKDCSYAALDRWVEEQFESWDDLAKELQSTDAQTALTDIWNAAIALMITLGYDHSWFSDLIRLLQVAHLINWVLAFQASHPKLGDDPAPRPSDAALSRALNAVMILPADIFPIDPPPAPADPPAIQLYAVGAIRTVHYKPGRYALGDIERIETVISGETRQEVHRNLRRKETVEEEQTSSDSTSNFGRDTTTADLINQVQKTLSDRVSTTTINNYETDYGQPATNSMKVTGNWWVQEQPAGGYLQDISKFARDVIDRSVKALRRESVLRRSSRVFEELETTQTRTLSNTGGNGNLQAVFRWVNRAYHLQTRASQDRLVFEMFIDNPSAHLVQAIARYHELRLAAPPSPASMGITSYANLSPDPVKPGSPAAAVYYLDAFQAYGIAPDSLPPPALRVISNGFKSRNPLSDAELDVPEGYTPVSAAVSISSFVANPTAQVTMSGVILTADQTGTLSTFKGYLTATPAQYSDRLRVSILCSAPMTSSAVGAASGKQAGSGEGDAPAPDTSPAEGATAFDNYYVASIEVQCARSAATLANWQIATYQKIQAAYQAAMADYQAALAQQKKALDAENPKLLTQVVQDQIVQAAIALFAGATLAKPTDTTGKAGAINFEPRYFQFLRHSFDWDGMAVEFIQDPAADPYLSDGQSALISLFSPSRYLRDLLRAKRAHILLSVKPEAARTVLLAFRTGQIWPCSEDLTPCMAVDMSAVDLLLEQPDEGSKIIHDSWSITVPTAMVALSHDNPFS
ncbi:hypothetical protein [Rhizobium hainanense]|uniref:Uncharacterized protein n=1 Tax=Rhizobium hainanense TaxID=52131 RepID=A0A1C3VB44_9HYPH|nr:hypothetical protein [Rhizobium hainanense]SCB24898.1 hypothetical protein GA0061100_105170 [Rhizobium hainanense]